MQQFHIKSLPFKEVLSDLAKAMNTRCLVQSEEYKLEIPPPYGTGLINGINFHSGLGLLLYDCQFSEEVELHFTVNAVHPLKFIYVTRGELEHRFENAPDRHLLSQFLSAMIASTGSQGHVLRFKAGAQVKVASLEIDRAQFKANERYDLSSLPPSIQEILQDHSAQKSFYQQGDYTLNLADTIAEMEDFRQSDIIRRIFLEGKAYHILAHQLVQFEDDLSAQGGQKIIRRSEIDKIIEAIRIIQQELGGLDTVKALARRVGTNESKLQAGFKSLTGSTVNQYIQNARLDAAKELLISSDLSISEIVYSIGLSNRGYFSRIFKERYQISPSVFRGRKRKEDVNESTEEAMDSASHKE